MSHDPEIHELEALIATDPREAGYPVAAERAVAILDTIAATLRDPQQRDPLGGTTLPESISRILKSAVDSKDRSKPTLDCLAQAARVAANLAADCNVNRTRLAEAGYMSSALALLASRPVLPPAALRPLVASIMNLVVERHAECIKLVNPADLRAIVTLAGEIYSPAKGGDSLIASWLWTIADAVVPTDTPPASSLTVADLQLFLPPLAAFAPRAVDAELDPSQVLGELAMLAHATAILDRFNAADKLEHAAIIADQPTMDALFAFIEDAVLPAVDFDDDDSDDEDSQEAKEPGKEQEKSLGMAKAAAARTVVALLAEATAPQSVWERVVKWMDLPDRPDLVACALLSYGNRARSDEAATSLLPTVLSHILPLMEPTTPVLVQHALIGLLRNLSIPEANKLQLGNAGVLERLVAMQPWGETRDVLGSIQGGAVGIVKNLVRESANATRFLEIPAAVPALHALIKRTNDAAIAMEAGRVWVNAIRSLAKVRSKEDGSSAVHALATPAVIGDLCQMLSRGERHAVLVSEGVLALTLLVLFGSAGPDVEAALLVDPNAGAPATIDEDGSSTKKEKEGERARSAAQVIAGVLAPAPGRALSAEMQANALALVGVLPYGGVRGVVRAELKKAREEGRPVAAGVEVLEK